MRNLNDLDMVDTFFVSDVDMERGMRSGQEVLESVAQARRCGPNRTPPPNVLTFSPPGPVTVTLLGNRSW